MLSYIIGIIIYNIIIINGLYHRLLYNRQGQSMTVNLESW